MKLIKCTIVRVIHIEKNCRRWRKDIETEKKDEKMDIQIVTETYRERMGLRKVKRKENSFIT